MIGWQRCSDVSTCMLNIFEVKKPLIFKLWVKAGCEVGKNGFYSERWYHTIHIEKKSCVFLFLKLKNSVLKDIRIYRATRLLLVKCYDNKMVKSPYNCVIYPLTQPQVANQDTKNS